MCTDVKRGSLPPAQPEDRKPLVLRWVWVCPQARLDSIRSSSCTAVFLPK